MTVRVRFAPSPTGHLHVGGARTALFNWLFARHHGGVFVLRIEDTDMERSTEQAIRAILEGMSWLGLTWDEGPFRQTDRLEIYRAHVDRLLAQANAYRCNCTPADLEARRKAALARGEVPKYDGRCRDRDIPLERPAAIRFRASQEGETVVEDRVKGTVVFDNKQLDDLIILRSDGMPTYNLCVVVDDVTMAITHVIRGDDHLNNTPRQIQLYRAFGYSIPQFAHLPMILGQDRARLSKRHGATSVSAYRDMGYLPEALVNYLARLGWSYGDQEIFSQDELIRLFDLETVGKSAAVFNPEKLLWLNSHYIAQAPGERLAKLLPSFLDAEGIHEKMDHSHLARVAETLQSRSRTMVEMARSARTFLQEEVKMEEKARAKFLTPATASLLERLIPHLEALEPFSPETLEPVFQGVIAEAGIKLGKLAQPVRVAVTGGTVSPGIYEVLALVGKDRVLRRLRQAVALCKP